MISLTLLKLQFVTSIVYIHQYSSIVTTALHYYFQYFQLLFQYSTAVVYRLIRTLIYILLSIDRILTVIVTCNIVRCTCPYVAVVLYVHSIKFSTRSVYAFSIYISHFIHLSSLIWQTNTSNSMQQSLLASLL